MKKIKFLTLTLVFALTLGVAYASEDVTEKSNKELYNGITDFTGRILDAESDNGAAGGIVMGGGWSVEGSGAGGLSASDPGEVPYNGITEFTGRILDAESDSGAGGGIVMGGSSVEASGAGGLSAGEPSEVPFNGITDFNAPTLDPSPGIGM